MTIEQLVVKAREDHASDIHLICGLPPKVRYSRSFLLSFAEKASGIGSNGILAMYSLKPGLTVCRYSKNEHGAKSMERTYRKPLF